MDEVMITNIPKEAFLSDDAAEDLRRSLDQKLLWGRRFWKPLHDRQDYWLNMYLLLDLMQQSKPLGFRRFVSNDPQTAPDAAISMITRNEAFWRIDMPAGEIGKEERAFIGEVERALGGIVDDVDEMFLLRGEMPFWKQAAWFAVMRGWIWAKLHVTKAAIDMGRDSPLLAEMWDSRQVYPTFNGLFMSDVLAEKHSNLSEVQDQYPEKAENVEGTDGNSPIIKVEYWSNTVGDRQGVTGTLAYVNPVEAGLMGTPTPDAAPIAGGAVWLQPPYRHGLKPNALPVVGAPVNGIPIKTKPLTGELVDYAMRQRADRIGVQPPSWHDPSGWVAESGRGLLASVEENIPQYNELVATALQHFSIGTYPTMVFWTASGELPPYKEGMNAKIPLRIGEQVQRMEPTPINADAWKLLAILQDERQRGMLSNILQASSAGGATTGAMLQQILHAALNALEPFSSGLKSFGQLAGSHILAQLQASKDLPRLDLVSRSGRSYFRIDFDPASLGDRKYKPIPIFKISLPQDLQMKAQVARILLDPRRPIMSLVTVLDQVLEYDDPEGEIKRMFADIANLDPIIVLERVATALEEEGEVEIANRIRQTEFQQAFVKEAQFRAISAQIAGPSAETGATTATGGNEQVREGQGQAGEPNPLGASGERNTP
jgi:hypothetical protein